MSKPLAILLSLLYLTACDPNTTQTPKSSDANDAGPDLTEAPDASHDLHTQEDAPPQPTPPTWTVVQRTNGDEVRGEQLAIYNHNLWWDPEPRWTIALFNPERFAAYPLDRSLTFLSSDDILTLTQEPAPANTPSYRDFLKAKAMNMAQSPLAQSAYIITASESYHKEEWGYGDFALDLVQTDDHGRWFTNQNQTNEDHFIWDTPVLSPISGTVVEVIRNAPDNDIASYTLDDINNFVGIGLGGNYYVYLLHMRQNTIPEDIVPGTLVSQGQHLGTVGNSGISAEPHLHIAVLWLDTQANPPRSWSVPFFWSNLEVSPTPQGPFQPTQDASPPSKTWVR